MYQVLLLPHTGIHLRMKQEFKQRDVAANHGSGYAQSLNGRNYGPWIDVVVVDRESREAVNQERIDK